VLGALGAAVLAGCSGGPSDEATDADPAADTTDAGERETTRTDEPSRTTEAPTAEPTTETTPSDPADPPGSGGSWAVPGYDLANTGYNADAVGPGGPVDRVWKTDVEGIYTMSQVSVHDGRLFTASGEKAYAMDARTGDVQWTRRLEYLGHHYSVAATDDTVFVPSRTLSGSTQGGGSGAVTAFSVADGGRQWRHETPVTTAPVPAGDTLFYGASTGDRTWLAARSTADGSERWRHGVEGTEGFVAAFGEPAVTESLVISTATVDGGAGNDTGSLAFALDRSTGERVWERSFDAAMNAAPVVRDGRVYVATRAGELAALSVADGTPRWNRRVDGEIYSTPATDGDLLVALERGELVGFGAESGTVRWRSDLGVVLINSVVLTDSTVYVGGEDLRALDRTDGTVEWSLPIAGAGGGYGGPIVTGETVFVGACVKPESRSQYDDSVYALQRARE
jgi:outer membrane protein assembly factor BamB